MYRANLSFTQLNIYLTLLMANHLMSQVSFEGKDIYQTTVKGTGFLQRHRELVQMIEKP